MGARKSPYHCDNGHFTVVNDSEVTATFTISAGATLTIRNVGVNTPIGGTNTVEFTVVAPILPTLGPLSPSSGVRGTAVPVTLTGTNFTATGTSVAITGTGVTVGAVTVVNSTQISATFTISNTATISGRTVTVTTPGGTSNIQTFTVLGPVLNSISSSVIYARGTSFSITVTGTGITNATAISVSGGGVTVTNVTVVNDTEATATFTIAANAGLTARTVTVTTTPGGTSNTVTFTVVDPPLPTLTSLSPTIGVRGSTFSVMLLGSNFTAAGTSVSISGGGVTVGTITVVNSGEITTTFTITAAAGLTARTVLVSNPGGNSGNQSFTVLGPALSSIIPNPATHGTGVALNLGGMNLSGATGVTISGAGSTCTVNGSNATSVTASCTLTTGTKTVKVVTPIGTTGPITLTVN